MVVLGIDAHKRTHTVVAVDEHGRQLAVQHVRHHDRGSSRTAALGRAVRRRPAVGGRGLPAPVAAARARPAGRG